MKVLYLAPAATRPDRLTNHTFLDEEIRAFSAAGVDAHVLSTSVDGSVDSGGVSVHGFPAEGWRGRAATLGFMARHAYLLSPVMLRHFRETGYHLRHERLIAAFVRENRIDIVHSMFAWPGGFGGVFARASGRVPLVANFRGMDLLMDPHIGYGMRLSPLQDAAVRLLVRNADRTLYPTSFLRGRGVELGADPDQAVAIPKGVDTNAFQPATDRERLRAELGFDGPMILCVCVLIRRKSVDTVIRALSRLRHVPDLTLAVCGDGPERANLERLARELGVAERVRFLGYVERTEIPRYFAACDAFVLTSIVEAAGNVVLEAMASGRPVVCTDSGGPPEYVNHDDNGFVVPPRDDTALAGRLEELLLDPAAADAMGERGRALAVAKHPYRRMVDDVMEFYAVTVRAGA